MAVAAVADAARDADGFKLAAQIKAIGIDQSVGVLHLAADADRIAADGCVEAAA